LLDVHHWQTRLGTGNRLTGNRFRRDLPEWKGGDRGEKKMKSWFLEAGVGNFGGTNHASLPQCPA
jgi:hypothetical protein